MRAGIRCTPELLFALIIAMVVSCTATDNDGSTGSSGEAHARPGTPSAASDTGQISQYIRRIFEDRDGELWFGTTTDGAVRYDGEALTYFNARNGLGSDWVSSIAQDLHGDLWFGTRDGIARYDGQHFTRYTTADGLTDSHVHCLLIDHQGWLWAATEGGVSCFDGERFNAFDIPAADLGKFPYQEGPKRINWMIQDKAKNIWFASNGGGAYRFDGKTLINYSTKDGLCDNFVQTILEDSKDGVWFGTRYGGACRYDGSKFNTFGRKDLRGEDVSSLYQDRNGTLWIGVTRVGLCGYANGTFTCYSEKDGAGIRVIICALEDAQGRLWFGTGAGVYQQIAGSFVHWTRRDVTRTGTH